MQVIIAHQKEPKPIKRFLIIIFGKNKQVTIPITAAQEKKINQFNKDETP